MSGDDGLRAQMIAALPGCHPWGDVADALLPVVTAWAERRARERAAEELRNVADGIVGGGANIRGLPMAVKQALGIAADVAYVRADELAADDRTGQR